ncbi:MAG: hypothetical protein D6744_00785 [Planctomycetota bacterium]|nr:MAG: hypothetical protein D6744_00785 [Planctomycetota bacterium]
MKCLRIGSFATLWIAAVAATTGCGGKYTINFEVADVINAPGNDLSREELDVDILCLTKKEAAEFKSAVNKTMRSDEWFQKRDTEDSSLSLIDASHIYALRRGTDSERRDILLGPPLLSFIDRRDGKRTLSYTIEHEEPGEPEAAIVIYGRFRGTDGIARTEPVVVQPPPGFGKSKSITVRIGRTNMELAGDS